jgi:hypothetical protein
VSGRSLIFHLYTDKFSDFFVSSSAFPFPTLFPLLIVPFSLSPSPPSRLQVFDHCFSCADRGVLPAMIPLILPGVLSGYHDTDVLASVVLIVPCLPFKHHDFDVRGPTGIDTAVARWIKAPGRRHRSVSLVPFPFTMTITKPNKLSGQAPRAPHKAANSPASTSASAASAARKSGRVPRPTFKVVDALASGESLPSSKLSSRPSLKAADSFSSLSSSPSQPPLRAADSISSLTSSSSRPPLKASDSVLSLCSTTLSRASSPVSETRTHISVTDSEGEVDPQVELGTSSTLTAILHPLTFYQTS